MFGERYVDEGFAEGFAKGEKKILDLFEFIIDKLHEGLSPEDAVAEAKAKFKLSEEKNWLRVKNIVSGFFAMSASV